MASSEVTYELQRQRTIEENKKRLLELGILQVATVLSPPKPKSPIIRRVQSYSEKRRSSRLTNHPKVSYKEVQLNDESNPTSKRTRTHNGVLRRGYAPEDSCIKVGEGNPSFVKEMLKSHVSGGFWLGLPTVFCQTNFKANDRITLEDEDGREWECIYLHNRNGLSGGWRGFSIDHDLREGDSLVYELVEPLRLKVHIRRAGDGPNISRAILPVARTKEDIRNVPEITGAILPVVRTSEDTCNVDCVRQEATLTLEATDANIRHEEIVTPIRMRTRSTDANSEAKQETNDAKKMHSHRQVQLRSFSKTMTTTKASTVVSRFFAKPLTRAVKEQLQSLPQGARPKAVAVCSFASLTNVSRKRIPTMFPIRKHSFARYSGGKPVKVR